MIFLETILSSHITFGISRDNPCTDAVPVDELDPLCEAKSAPLDIPEEGISNPDESGIVLFRLPEAGTYTFTTTAMSQRDAEGDGYENALDTCPLDPNQGNPRIKGDGDLDEDGLDAACDPNDDPLAGGLNSDEGEEQVNVGTLQLFYWFSLGGGWQVGGSPIPTANYVSATEADFTIPINFGAAKTFVLGTMPLKTTIQGQYFVTRPDVAGQSWGVFFQVTPVVKVPW